MIRRSRVLVLIVLAATTASSAVAAHPTERFSVTAQNTLRTKPYLQSIKPAKPTGSTAAVRVKAEEAKGYLSPMPW
jgi:hypothetical protein